MPRYRLRTLLIVLALGPPLLTGIGAVLFLAWVRWQEIPIATDGAAMPPPPWDPTSIEAKMTPGQWLEYSEFMNPEQQAAERNRLGIE